MKQERDGVVRWSAWLGINRMTTKQKQHAALPSIAPSTPHPTAVEESNKQAAKKLNAKKFFIELVYSLAPGKGMTKTQQMQYRRVLAFLDA